MGSNHRIQGASIAIEAFHGHRHRTRILLFVGGNAGKEVRKALGVVHDHCTGQKFGLFVKLLKNQWVIQNSGIQINQIKSMS